MPGDGVTGFATPAGRYCAITGGRYSVSSAPGVTQELGNCAFPNGRSCEADAHYAGTCSGRQVENFAPAIRGERRRTK